MINLSPSEEDALIEIGNVGISKAARQLSMLLDCEIELTIPKVAVYEKTELFSTHKELSNENSAYVYQTLDRDLSGLVLFFFNKQMVPEIVEPIMGSVSSELSGTVSEAEQEVLLEIGNIIMSSCVASVSNMLSNTIDLSVPFYSDSSITDFISNQAEQTGKALDDILFISTRLHTTEETFSCSLVLVLTSESTEKLFHDINRLLKEM